MTENTELWDRLGRTDPAHTKGFKRAGGFTGTAIKPMWAYRRLTEEFGPCGVGWGVDKPDFQVVQGDNREVLVFCTVSGWYVQGESRHTVFGVGGDKVVTHIKGNEQYNRPERWENDDEAFKKAFTDAITNAFKFVGVGADVHMGMFDDNKYVRAMEREFSEEAKKPSAAEMKRKLEEIEHDLLDCKTIPDVDKCAKVWAALMARDNWPKDYKDIAAPKFGERRDAIRKAAEIPGNTGIHDPTGRELNIMEGA